jgi:phosphate/sulfate permease
MAMGYFTAIVVVLLLLAVMDLVVGVSNDAVNFLNSAIGSRVASFRTIIIVAASGVILGSVFSSGIMEVARTGIMNPARFTFDRVMWIFLAVMMTDIVLLDIFNTLGLPTSTTVSIVFELLGASLMAAFLFTIDKSEPFTSIGSYINAGSTLTIVSGIFLSILLAFSAGILVQYLCRLIFTFHYEDRLDRYGVWFAGAGITAIAYFLLVKGLSGTTLIRPELAAWISGHTWLILGGLFGLSVLIAALLKRFARVNPLKLVVLIGTFSLAMAFAGNDLVNFIGVPVAGYLAFLNWKQSGIAADQQYQEYLASTEVIVPNWMLLLSGIIMALTLWLSAKARKVTETEVNLGSQQEGEERFKPNMVARNIVKSSMLLGGFFKLIVPESIRNAYDLSFEKAKIRQATIVHDKPAFDLVRASANLVIASSLIALATSYKLPLSTTYVSFMVAMGTSLADKAWGRETAVYRVAGVLSVIGGWFITAVIAFSVSALFVLILIRGGVTATFILLGVVAFYLIASHIGFSKRSRQDKERDERVRKFTSADVDIFKANRLMMEEHTSQIFQRYDEVLRGLLDYDANRIEAAYLALREQEEFGRKLRAESVRNIRNLEAGNGKSGELLLYSTDLLQDMMYSTVSLAEESLHYVQNLHYPPNGSFSTMVEALRVKMQMFAAKVRQVLGSGDFSDIESLRQVRDDARVYVNLQLENQIESIHREKPGTRQAMLTTNILLQSRDILAISLRVMKMYRKLGL